MFNYYYFFKKVQEKKDYESYLLKRIKKVSIYGLIDILSKVPLSVNFCSLISHHFNFEEVRIILQRKENLVKLKKIQKINDITGILGKEELYDIDVISDIKYFERNIDYYVKNITYKQFKQLMDCNYLSPEIILKILKKDNFYDKFVYDSSKNIHSIYATIIPEQISIDIINKIISSDRNLEAKRSDIVFMLTHQKVYFKNLISIIEDPNNAEYADTILDTIFDKMYIPKPYKEQYYENDILKNPDYVYEYNCGVYNRRIFIRKDGPTRIQIGCFRGTKEEAITAVKARYENSKVISNFYMNDYIAKIESCFNRVNEENDE